MMLKMSPHHKPKDIIDAINSGSRISVGGLQLRMQEDGVLTVMGWTQWIHLDSLSKDIMLKELDAIKREFQEITGSSSEVKTYLEGKPIEYILYYDDYGKASIVICKEKDGYATWFLDMKD